MGRQRLLFTQEDLSSVLRTCITTTTTTNKAWAHGVCVALSQGRQNTVPPTPVLERERQEDPWPASLDSHANSFNYFYLGYFPSVISINTCTFFSSKLLHSTINSPCKCSWPHGSLQYPMVPLSLLPPFLSLFCPPPMSLMSSQPSNLSPTLSRCKHLFSDLGVIWKQGHSVTWGV